MALKAEKVDMWAGPILDRPGNLAKKLAALAAGGVNLQFVLARRAPDKPGMGVVFLAGVQGAKQAKAAQAAGLIRTKTMASVHVEGPNRRGMAAKMTAALAEAGVNLRGFSGACLGPRFVAFLALDTSADAGKAIRVLRKL
jgi:hypothetical protein